MSEKENIDHLLRFLHANRESTFDGASGTYTFSAWVTYHHSVQNNNVRDDGDS
jgi:hypothetical protein